MARCVALLAALVLLAGTATAYAESPKSSAAPTIYQKPQMAIFDEGDEVIADLPTLGESIIDVPMTTRFGTLIQVRESFIPELIKSCEDL
ncbi:MAG: hypothetical protein HY906_11555 [Deltaproteobacteria bacterium]|nr:hypothetical protein [Deltaproteobacteria bacterium]